MNKVHAMCIKLYTLKSPKIYVVNAQSECRVNNDNHLNNNNNNYIDDVSVSAQFLSHFHFLFTPRIENIKF